MLTKNNLWYLTLFSIVVVLAVYYVSFPMDKKVAVAKETGDATNVTIKKTGELTAMRATRDEEREKQITEVQNVLNDNKKSAEEKNDQINKR